MTSDPRSLGLRRRGLPFDQIAGGIAILPCQNVKGDDGGNSGPSMAKIVRVVWDYIHAEPPASALGSRSS
jgi:hypothetical protein